jgi:hypothetical protein
MFLHISGYGLMLMALYEVHYVWDISLNLYIEWEINNQMCYSRLMPLFFFVAGIPKFILISVHDYNLPSFLLSSGYFTGKRKAESEVLSKFPNSGHYSMPFMI